MLKLFRLHVPELRFWKIKKKYEKIKTKIEEKYKKENVEFVVSDIMNFNEGRYDYSATRCNVKSVA